MSNHRHGHILPSGGHFVVLNAMSTVSAEGAMPAMEVLLQELPLEDNGLVSLGVLAERLSNSAYQTIQSLGDTLPSLSSNAKRAKIYATAIELRKIFIKLLVLVRWSKDADLLNRARNVVGLLVEQQWAHEDVFSGLTQVRKILPNARMCDADLVTAIDVLRSGTYERLPLSIKDSTIPAKPLSDAEALAVLHDLDEILSVRLACSETIPLGMKLKNIEDGKAYFEAKGLYNVCLTTSGPNSEDRWWILDFHFSDPIPEGHHLDAILTQPYLNQVYEVAESILSPNATDVDTEPVFSKLHQLLTQHALQRRLHILHYQIQKMSQNNWGSSIMSSLDPDSRTLELSYWVPNLTSTMLKSSKSLVQGKIKLSLVNEDNKGHSRVFSSLLFGDHVQTSSSLIKVEWVVDEKIRDALSSTEPSFLLSELDMEKLLLSTIDNHSQALLQLFQSDIHAHVGLSAGNPGVCKLRRHEKNNYCPKYSLEIKISDTVSVMLYVSVITGRVGMSLLDGNEENDELNLSLSRSENVTLQRMTDQINADPRTLAEALFSYRLQCITKNLQLQVSWLGLPYLTTVPLKHGELNKLGLQNGQPLLFVPLGVVPGYYLMLYFVPGQQLSMALISIISEAENGKSWQVISSVKWLDKSMITHYSLSGADLINAPRQGNGSSFVQKRDGIQSEDLELALNYCIATVVYSHIEEQLRLMLIPFALVGVTTNTPAPPTSSHDPLLPSLRIRSKELLSPFDNLVEPNVSLQLCDWWYPSKRRAEITFKVKLYHTSRQDTIEIFEGTLLDLSNGLIHYATRDMVSSLNRLNRDWPQIAMMCELINETTNRESVLLHTTLGSISTQRITIHYDNVTKMKPRFTCQVHFNSAAEQNSNGRYSVLFGTESEQITGAQDLINAHCYITNVLQTKMNQVTDLSLNFWKSFFTVSKTKASYI